MTACAEVQWTPVRTERARPAESGFTPTQVHSAVTNLLSGLSIDQRPRFKDMLDKVFAISELKQGWDGRTSPSLTGNAMESAITVAFLSAYQRASVLAVIPVPGGGVQFELQRGSREIEIEVLPDGMIEVLVIIGSQHSEQSFDLAQDSSLRRLLQLMDGV